MESKKKGYEEPRGRTGIKTQTQRMDLRTWGGGRESWDKVRERNTERQREKGKGRMEKRQKKEGEGEKEGGREERRMKEDINFNSLK